MKFETSVKEIIPRTLDITSFRFPRPAELTYKAGQYFVCFIKSADGKQIVHHFSFSSSPTEKDYIEFTKKLTVSEYSAALKNLKVNAWSLIDAPYGSFTFGGEYPKICLLTGGIGITPFRSIVKYCTDMGINSSIVLLYGCRSPDEIVFREDFEQMAKQNINLKLVFTVNQPDSEWKSYIGNISLDIVKKEVPDYAERTFYACGPPGMIAAMKNLIQQLQIPENRMKVELFTGYS